MTRSKEIGGMVRLRGSGEGKRGTVEQPANSVRQVHERRRTPADHRQAGDALKRSAMSPSGPGKVFPPTAATALRCGAQLLAPPCTGDGDHFAEIGARPGNFDFLLYFGFDLDRRRFPDGCGGRGLGSGRLSERRRRGERGGEE